MGLSLDRWFPDFEEVDGAHIDRGSLPVAVLHRELLVPIMSIFLPMSFLFFSLGFYAQFYWIFIDATTDLLCASSYVIRVTPWDSRGVVQQRPSSLFASRSSARTAFELSVMISSLA